MKTLIYTTVAATALSGAAFAQQTEDSINMTLDQYAFIVDAAVLDDTAKAEILAEVNSGDPKPETERAIAQILRDEGFASMEMAEETIWYIAAVEVEPHSLRNLVDIKLADYEVEIDTAALSDEQVVEIYALLADGEEPDPSEIEAVVAQ